ncbi:MAG: uracil-DNA glycosylase [Chlorobium sp.]|uniref:uracil-DNA glycosylase n=1 Tax=Chlorobium sp. TaxID=1095 RepID=UPI0025B86CFB|nr:uracil-DNA glycosylase [Chlorobium sp.]MCF8216711.1 uracil-DNA glycosylase [Chlorobium sp.]MCF8271568.1 uracil-DNA glycosylase [Chlorobium sp.]MCF8287951.1 uracil-DNA glycosylase [Chlorobium sp.]MCF8291496.1 uracil-DNA glycosylase [Chlorobium sp.]MCF8385701.1 uracil-DNA glycosylase [Chlorobium sp.]
MDGLLLESDALKPLYRDLEALYESAKTCTKCRLASTRTNFVFGEGNPSAKLVVIGEAPGADEDAQGRPFVGRSGQLLDKILVAVGFRREDVFICNILKCRPPQNRNPLQDEIACCLPWLQRQLDLIEPRMLLLLGRVAANTLLGNTLSLGAMRGKILGWNRFECVVTYHPAALLRNPNWKRGCWEDVQLMRRHYDALEGTLNQP